MEEAAGVLRDSADPTFSSFERKVYIYIYFPPLDWEETKNINIIVGDRLDEKESIYKSGVIPVARTRDKLRGESMRRGNTSTSRCFTAATS